MIFREFDRKRDLGYWRQIIRFPLHLDVGDSVHSGSGTLEVLHQRGDGHFPAIRWTFKINGVGYDIAMDDEEAAELRDLLIAHTKGK